MMSLKRMIVAIMSLLISVEGMVPVSAVEDEKEMVAQSNVGDALKEEAEEDSSEFSDMIYEPLKKRRRLNDDSDLMCSSCFFYPSGVVKEGEWPKNFWPRKRTKKTVQCPKIKIYCYGNRETAKSEVKLPQKQVILMMLDERVVKVFEDLVEASTWLKQHTCNWVTPEQLLSVIQGNGSLCGFKWRFQEEVGAEELSRLLSVQLLDEQIPKTQVIYAKTKTCSSKIVLMKLNDSIVNAFMNVRDAGLWLKKSGYKNVKLCAINKAIRDGEYLYGFNWECKERAEVEKLGKFLRILPELHMNRECKGSICSEADTLHQVSFPEGTVSTGDLHSGQNSDPSKNMEHGTVKSEMLVDGVKQSEGEKTVGSETAAQKENGVSAIKNQFIVMKYGERPVKTFVSFYEAQDWLRRRGWKNANSFRIRQAIARDSLSYGWKWEIQDKTEFLEQLLNAILSGNTLKNAKKLSKEKLSPRPNGFMQAENQFIVMSFQKVPVKAFFNISEAVKWLRVHGWKSAQNSYIRRAMVKNTLSCGWNWSFQRQTKELKDLLWVDIEESLIENAKKHSIRKKYAKSDAQLLVMKFGEIPVKTFVNVYEVQDWLLKNGWNTANATSIMRTAIKCGVLYGWAWETQNKTEELEKLLGSEPTDEQIQFAKYNRRRSSRDFVSGKEVKSTQISLVKDDETSTDELCDKKDVTVGQSSSLDAAWHPDLESMGAGDVDQDGLFATQRDESICSTEGEFLGFTPMGCFGDEERIPSESDFSYFY